MPASNVKQLCEVSREKLKFTIEKLESFLNEFTLPQLVGDQQDEETVSFYKGYLADLRHLLVFSEVAYEKLGVTLRRAHFDGDFAERALYEVYHNSVNAFFYPKNECYSEDGRYAYTGQDAIRFRKKPVRAARDIILDITKAFEELRDELGYYESDYLTQRKMQGQK
ncbi:YpuI family protein [Paenibacillus sp. ACRRX]|uniref:YpuI family protein n=1 Tax=unclassified Paenibacillus TaxID=185978 RepID=UPI001EF73877|nr:MULTISPECIES: YpuI family protein [unclassified Paenibacillus]MCG7407830.1 YpuI family protein [Paenibacillus sp. ACRRX]MDK8180973.1 YpuI family protein [Paenibacillus sp. UMB4589-SE434]